MGLNSLTFDVGSTQLYTAVSLLTISRESILTLTFQKQLKEESHKFYFLKLSAVYHHQFSYPLNGHRAPPLHTRPYSTHVSFFHSLTIDHQILYGLPLLILQF